LVKFLKFSVIILLQNKLYIDVLRSKAFCFLENPTMKYVEYEQLYGFSLKKEFFSSYTYIAKRL